MKGSVQKPASAPLTYTCTRRRVKFLVGAMASANSHCKRKGRDDEGDQHDESPKKQAKSEGNSSKKSPPKQQQSGGEDPSESDDEDGDQDWREKIHDFGFPAIFDKAYERVGIRVRDQQYIYNSPGPGNPLVGAHPDAEVHKDRVEKWSEELAEFIGSDACLDEEGWEGVRPLGYGGYGKVGLWSREVAVEAAEEENEGGENRKGKATRAKAVESPTTGQATTKVEVST